MHPQTLSVDLMPVRRNPLSSQHPHYAPCPSYYLMSPRCPSTLGMSMLPRRRSPSWCARRKPVSPVRSVPRRRGVSIAVTNGYRKNNGLFQQPCCPPCRPRPATGSAPSALARQRLQPGPASTARRRRDLRAGGGCWAAGAAEGGTSYPPRVSQRVALACSRGALPKAPEQNVL